MALLCLLLAACSSDKSAASRGRPPSPVSVAAVEVRDVPVLIKSIARVEASSSVALKSRVTGQLLSVHFKEGAFVKKGDLLFTLDPRPFEMTLKEAEAALARDQALSAKAADDLNRFQELVSRKVVSAAQYEQYLTEARTRAATLKATQAAVENARLQLSYCYIHAPLSGPTGSLLADVGNMIKANDDNKSLVVIQQIEPTYVVFNVPERQLAEIRAAMAKDKLPVEAALPGQESKPLTGDLVFVDNAVDPATGTIRLKAGFANVDHRLWPGQFVAVSLRLANLPSAMVVPSRALQSGQIGDFVFVVSPEMTVQPRKVVPGLRLDGQQVITSGLKSGEQVVVDGHLRLVPGAKVEIKPQVGGHGGEKS
jgi:multidrug efflux system membrane fusion protein